MTVDLGIGGLEPAELIARGGHGAVYRSRQPALDREVAVKILPLADDTTKRRFDRERAAMGRLSQTPGVVPVYESGFTERGEPYIVMPFLERGSLQQYVDDHGPMEWTAAVQVCAKVAEAISRAHDAGILHRDVKPGNILLSSEGEPLVADFGIARVAGTEVTASTSVSLSPAFASPEALRGGESTPSNDIYGLGATLYTLLTAEAPFVGDVPSGDVPALMAAIVERPVFGDNDRGLPPELIELVRELMAKAPEDRPGDLTESAAQLRALLPAGDGGGTDPFVDTVDRSPAQAPARRQRRIAAFVGTATVVVAAIVAAVVVAPSGGDSEGAADPGSAGSDDVSGPTTEQPAAVGESPPSEPTGVLVGSPSSDGDVFLDPPEVFVVVEWQAPSDPGGSAVTGYTITPELMEGTQINRTGTVEAFDSDARSASVTAPRSDVPDSYYRYTVAAVNDDGEGPGTIANVEVPDVIGLCDWRMYQHAWAVGLRARVNKDGPAAAAIDDCKGDGGDGLIAQQQQRSGSEVEAGETLILNVFDYSAFE